MWELKKSKFSAYDLTETIENGQLGESKSGSIVTKAKRKEDFKEEWPVVSNVAEMLSKMKIGKSSLEL